MPRKRRSEKLAEVAVRPAPVPTEALAVAEKILSALCPVCGRTIPENRALRIGYVTVGKVGYFESIDWDPDKPFGVSFRAGGRNAFKDWEHIGPEEAPELFEALKARFIQALKEWVAKGWIKEDEI